MTAMLMLRRCSQPIARQFSTSLRRKAILGDGDAAAFDEHVIKGNKLVFVDFHADVSLSIYVELTATDTSCSVVSAMQDAQSRPTTGLSSGDRRRPYEDKHRQ